jgi:hypothetical protein
VVALLAGSVALEVVGVVSVLVLTGKSSWKYCAPTLCLQAVYVLVCVPIVAARRWRRPTITWSWVYVPYMLVEVREERVKAIFLLSILYQNLLLLLFYFFHYYGFLLNFSIENKLNNLL